MQQMPVSQLPTFRDIISLDTFSCTITLPMFASCPWSLVGQYWKGQGKRKRSKIHRYVEVKIDEKHVLHMKSTIWEVFHEHKVSLILIWFFFRNVTAPTRPYGQTMMPSHVMMAMYAPLKIAAPVENALVRNSTAWRHVRSATMMPAK